MKRDLDRLLGVFYAFERKKHKDIGQELRAAQEEIYKKIDCEQLKVLFDKYLAMVAKNEYELEKRLITFVYDYFDMFDDE